MKEKQIQETWNNVSAWQLQSGWPSGQPDQINEEVI